MVRRTFLALGLALAGIGRRAWARVAQPDAVRFAPLRTPIHIPVAAVSQPWTPVKFTAEGTLPASGGRPAKRVILNGIVFRRQSPGERSPVSALCVTCPHEQCEVDLVTDPERLARMQGGITAHPMFECGCHASVFDALEDGARIAGPTPRGLYRFKAAVGDAGVEITEVEESALAEV
jgi:Rieske Fe-S protein